MTEPLTLGTLCSGIGAPEQAAHELGGWQAVFASEIAEWPRRILAARFGAGVGNGPKLFGDFTAVDLDDFPSADVLVAGTPCQAFSVAGGRLSLADARGNLTIAALGVVHGLAARPIRPLRNFVWENVPGVLNTPDNAFGCFLGELVGADAPICPPGAEWGWIEGKGDEPGAYGWKSCKFTSAGMVSGPRGRAAWRVFNSQYFGLAQRRQRVFVVADFGNGADPAAVLFERRGRAGDFAPSGGQGESFADDVENSADGSGSEYYPRVSGTLGSVTGGFRTTDLDGVGAYIPEPQQFCARVSGTLSPGAHPGGYNGQDAYNGMFVPVAYDLTQVTSPTNRSNPQGGDPAPPLVESGKPPVVTSRVYAIQERATSTNPANGPDGAGFRPDLAYTLEARAVPQAVAFKMRGREGGNMPEVMPGEISPSLTTDGGGSSLPFVATAPIAFSSKDYGQDATRNLSPTMRAGNHLDSHQNGGTPPAVAYAGFGWVVRRLTPVECHRLQGFPDTHCAITADMPFTPQYSGLGNSMSVPVLKWLLGRLQEQLRGA